MDSFSQDLKLFGAVTFSLAHVLFSSFNTITITHL